VAADRVQVGPADAARTDPHEDVARSRLGDGHVLDRERLPDLVKDGGLHLLRHDAPPSFGSPHAWYSGVHWKAATRRRSPSGTTFGAPPARTASRATAVATATATPRTSRMAGSSEPVGLSFAGLCSPSARAAARIIPSVTRRAPDATSPRPTAGK